MDDTITVSASALFTLLSQVFPNPDDPGDPNNPWGPYGPGGPVIHLEKPHPEPWVVNRMVDTVLDTVIALDQFAVAMPDFSEKIYGNFSRSFSDDIDWCGTKYPGWWRRKLKGKHGPVPVPDPEPYAVDLIGIAVRFNDFALQLGEGHPLQADFQNASRKLLDMGMSKLQG